MRENSKSNEHLPPASQVPSSRKDLKEAYGKWGVIMIILWLICFYLY
jgi:hypothetical protein